MPSGDTGSSQFHAFDFALLVNIVLLPQFLDGTTAAIHLTEGTQLNYWNREVQVEEHFDRSDKVNSAGNTTGAVKGPVGVEQIECADSMRKGGLQ